MQATAWTGDASRWASLAFALTSLASTTLVSCGRDPAPRAATVSPGASREAVVPLPVDAVLPTASGAGRPAALVELYTSEGCSSCPSADELVNALDVTSRAEKKRVYVLAFHVDYWDQIGWPDPFSDAAYTARQRERSRRAGRRGVYTPEAAVQGQAGFVGSDQAQLRASVARALETPPAVRIESFSVDASRTATWSVTGLPASARVHVAVTETGLSVQVRAGENAGRTLHHEGVVRSFRTTKEARGQLALGALPTRGSVVLFVEAEDGSILGAEAVDLDGTKITAR